MTSGKPLQIEDFLIPVTQLTEETGRIIPSILSIDIGLSGGFVEGINVLISGVQKLGKTSLSLCYAAYAQKFDPNKNIYFFDVEGRLRPELIQTTAGLNIEKFKIIKSNKNKILSAENYLNLILNILKDDPGCVVILDSIASLSPEAELSSMVGDSIKLASVPTLMYKVFRHTSQILSVTKSTFIALTHLIANPTPGQKKNVAVGGRAIAYGASINLEGGWKKDIVYGERTVGQTAMFKVNASALGPPGAEIKVPIIWGKGVHRATDTFNVAVELGLIKKAGAWFEIPHGDGLVKTQGQEKAIDFLESETGTLDLIEKQIRDMVL